MALLHTITKDGKRLEVRSAGRTRRLYVDGVLHTQYNPRLPLTGGVWDYLAFSALLAPSGAIGRVLLLGLGGGAVVHLLRRYVQPSSIVAVELDATKLRLARRFFHVAQPDTLLVQADACQWVANYNGLPFDLVIDDLFGEQAGEPVRAVPLDSHWTSALLRVLTRPGWLAVNTTSIASLARSPLVQRPHHRRRFPAAFCLTDALTDNAVACFCGTRTSSQAFRQRLRDIPDLATHRARQLMRFRTRTLWR